MLNKIDVDPSLAIDVEESVKNVLGLESGPQVSAKFGLGIDELLRFICLELP